MSREQKEKEKKILADNNGIEEKLLEENDENGQDEHIEEKLDSPMKVDDLKVETSKKSP